MINIDGVWVWRRVFGSEQADELRMESLQPSTKASAARTAVSPLLLPCFSVIDVKLEKTMGCFVWHAGARIDQARAATEKDTNAWHSTNTEYIGTRGTRDTVLWRKRVDSLRRDETVRISM